MVIVGNEYTREAIIDSFFHIAQYSNQKLVAELIRAAAFNLQELDQESFIDEVSNETANLTMVKVTEFLDKTCTKLKERITRTAESVMETINERAHIRPHRQHRHAKHSLRRHVYGRPTSGDHR